MHKSIISTIVKITLTLIFAFIGSIFILLVLLLDGISVQSYEISGIHVDKLYIKLDKKLVFEAEKIVVKESPKEDESTKSSELKELVSWLDTIQYALEFFQRIRIDSFEMDGERGFFLYDDGVFSIDSKPLSISAILEYENQKIKSKRVKAYIKDFNITIDGSGEYNLKNEHASIDARYDICGAVAGYASLDFDESVLRYELNSTAFKSMDFLKSLVEIENPNVYAWIYENIKADSFIGSGIRGSVDLKNPKYEELLGFSANLEIQNPKIKFNPNLKAVDAQKIEANLSNNKLFFTLYSPRFQGVELNGSSVSITNLFTSPAMLNIDLKSRAVLDYRVGSILKSYGINLPLRQLSGMTDVDLNLSLNLDNMELEAHGNMRTKESKLRLNELNIYAKELDAELNNSQVYIKESTANIGSILYGEKINMLVDTKKSLISGDMNVKDFNLTFDGTRLASIKNKKMDFEIEFSKEAHLIVDSIGLDARFTKGLSVFELKDISLLRAYSPFLYDMNITQGHIFVKSSDFEEFGIDAHIENYDTKLFKKSGERLDKLDLSITIGKKGVRGRTKDGLIEFDVGDIINIKLKEYTLFVDSDAAEKKTKDKSKNSPKIYIEAENGDIMFGRRRLLAQKYKLFNQSDMLSLELHYKGSKITVNMMDKYGSIYAKNLDDHYLNSYFGREIFFGGSYNVYGNILDDVIKGTLTTERARIKNLTTLNNILAFIDTVPSLVIFKKPGFNADGYEVESGKMNFGYSQGYFVVEELSLDGSSIDIRGKGIIDTNKESMDLSLRLLTLKSLSSIIGSIPIVGYIIMGDDKSVGTDVRVVGALDDPQVESQVLQDTIKTPLNIIERILKTPSRLLE